MKRVVVLAALIAAVLTGTAQAGPKHQKLDSYLATLTAQQADDLARAGFDVVAQRDGQAELVLTKEDRKKLADQGIKTKLKKDKNGHSDAQRASIMAANGFNVFRSWDEPGGISDELHEIAAQNPKLVKLEVLGHTGEGRELIAIKLTHDANKEKDGSRPAVLYSSAQHAREWISVEVTRRLLHWYIDEYNAKGKDRDKEADVKKIVNHTELWFFVVANPDGYQYTFEGDRLWRKNLRDNDGDHTVTNADGVDPNRNFDSKWAYDNEGSSDNPASQTYRGTAAGSEPETQAMQGLMTRIKPEFQANYHSFGPYILYPQGWSVGTLDADNPIYAALAGTQTNPAIEGFNPGQSADVLYVTNGETTDYASTHAGTIAFTPELDEGAPGAGFVFPDDEALVQAEFEKTIPFNLSLAKSAEKPDEPKSVLGIKTQPFYLTQTGLDPRNGVNSMFDFKFAESYGSPQEVRVLARRDIKDVKIKYKINGKDQKDVKATEWAGGERYGAGAATYYHVMRGVVTGAQPGDDVTVWFEGAGKKSESFTYKQVSDSGKPVLIMAAEDYSGASPPKAGVTAPQYLSYYTGALDANGVGYDVYDVNAHGRTAPSPLGILSHYKAVVWYTGDDTVTREPGWAAGNASLLADKEMLSVRDFINEGGKVFYSGQKAGWQYTGAVGTQLYDPVGNEQCSVGSDEVQARCAPLSGVGDGVNDVLEYWFGAGILNADAGQDENGDYFGLVGAGEPFGPLETYTLNGDSAGNQADSSSFLTISGLLPADQFPQFATHVAMKWDRPGGPYIPHDGDHYAYSHLADVSYKQVKRDLAVPAGGGHLKFWTSYDTEQDWDQLFVEVRHVGDDDWTTLPDANGHTTTATGDSCAAGWRELHPQMDHYQSYDPDGNGGDGACTPTGSTGSWNAATGNSGGWQQWDLDLGAYAGDSIEISISYVSDWATQGLGVFLDEIETTWGDGTTSFEGDNGGWAFDGPAAGSAPNPNTFDVQTAAGFPEGAAISTADTVYTGFGLEGIDGAANRAKIMDEVMDYLLG